jgi:hypothetical protein
VGSTGLGLLLEEQRGEIVAEWRQRVQHEVGVREPALAFAIAPLLREMTLALGSEGADGRSRDAWSRCAVLVRSTATSAQLAREYKVLHRCIWDTLRAREVPVSASDRTRADEWLGEALAEALDRLERVRLRVASYDRPPVVVPAAQPTRVTPPPLPSWSRLPRREGEPHLRPSQPQEAPTGDEPVLELDPIR